MPGGDPPGNHLERNRQAFGCCPAVDDDGEDRVLPQRGLPPAGVAEQIRLQAAPHASCGVQGVPAVAVFDASAERHLGQVLLPQPVVLERLGPGGQARSRAVTASSSRATSGENQPGTWWGAAAVIRSWTSLPRSSPASTAT